MRSSRRSLQELLRYQLDQIRAVFPGGALFTRRPDTGEIVRYYHGARPGYLRLYNRSGFIHIGLSRGPRDRPRASDLEAGARMIAEYIRKRECRNVLELAPGLGANSHFLAKRFPGTNFTGLDLSFDPLERYAGLGNYRQLRGDYHDLGRFDGSSFDLIFIIEALCYCRDRAKILEETARILKPGGLFVVIDGYARKERKDLSRIQRRAMLLTDRSMAVHRLESLTGFRRQIDSSPLALKREKSLTRRTLPGLARLQRMARFYFRFPALAHGLNRLLSRQIVRNAVAGLLLKTLVEMKVYCYYLHVLWKDPDASRTTNH